MSGIQIAGINGLLQKLRSMPQAITDAVSAEIQDGAQTIAAQAKAAAPGDQGILRQEIAAIKIDTTTWQVVSGAEYSPFVEFGTLEQVQIPPGLEEYAAQFKGGASINATSLGAKEAIFAWCERQGIDPKAWYPIYISIMAHGVAPRPFFFPAALRNEPIILDRIKLALSEAI